MPWRYGFSAILMVNRPFSIPRACDRREKALGIEIYNCFDYLRMRLHWNGCGLILHEFCHLIHQHALDGGLGNGVVKAAFRAAESSGKYESVLRRDWAGKSEDRDMAYAMVDHKEFFAEMSVTYFADGYRRLASESGTAMECCSPPIQEPITLTRLQKTGAAPAICSRQDLTPFDRLHHFWSDLFVLPSHQFPHCNKFYPFTRGQLKKFDPETAETMDQLWHDIAQWDDPQAQSRLCSAPCWKRPLPRTMDSVSDIMDL